MLIIYHIACTQAQEASSRADPEQLGEREHLAKPVQGLKARSLGHVPMQLCSGREAGQPKQHLDPMGLVLGAEKDNGTTNAEGSRAESQQHSLFVSCC